MKKQMTFATCMVVLIVSALVFMAAGKKQPKLFMVGDSTMADKTELEISPERGWGQLFPSYFNDDLIIENHAMNGRSTKSFVAESRWDSVLVRVRKGDVVMLQFGHNDAKRTDSTRYASIEDYEKNLVRMAEQAKKKGATVIICTPINRRSFSNETGKFVPKHGAYPEAARRAARRVGAPLLDFEAATAEWLTAIGDEESKQYFMNVAPGECTKFPEGKIDNTHLRENGAMVIGKMAADMIRAQKIKCLLKYLRDEDAVSPTYTVFCRPKMGSDRKPVESDLKTDLK